MTDDLVNDDDGSADDPVPNEDGVPVSTVPDVVDDTEEE